MWVRIPPASKFVKVFPGQAPETYETKEKSMNIGTKVEHVYALGLSGKITQESGTGIFKNYIRVRWYDGREFFHPKRFIREFEE